MNESLPKKILLATDGSEDAILSARAASDISATAGSGVHVVHALQPLPRYAYPGVTAEVYSRVLEVRERAARDLLDAQKRRIDEAGGKVAKVHLRSGPAVDEIIELAEELEAGLIVMGSRGMGLVERVVMGSVSEGVVHDASCPVLVLRGGEAAWPPARIVIADDGSEEATRAGELATGIGKLSGARALLLRAYPRLPEVDIPGRELNARMVNDELRREENILTKRAVELEQKAGIRPRVRIQVGDPAACILEAAQEEEGVEKALMAVGRRGLGMTRRVRLGSVSTKVLRAAGGPVLVNPRRNR
jgi:nucleotide-binding universal stress UspA family protein